jgi:hypothetical protein
MSLSATVANAATLVTAIGAVGGGALYLDNAHFPREAGMAMQAAGRVNTILGLVKEARDGDSPDWLCRAIDAEFIELCTESPDHYLCKDPDAKRELKTKAGCQ